MLKIVKGYGFGYAPGYSVGEPVKIDNTVYLPGEDEETGEVISAEEIKRRAEEEKAAEEKRFRESVDAEVSRILTERSAELEKERASIIESGKKEAADISAEAKAATMAIMEKAKKECAILKEQARKEGHDEGFAEGREQSLEKYKKCIDAAGKLLSEINARKEAYYISGEEEMRETVFELVNKIVRTELRTNPKVLESIIGEAAKNFRNSDYLKITLAEDAVTERFRTDEKLIKDIIPFIPEIELEFDDDAEEGTVIEDDGSQIVDAGVPTQLEFLKEVLKNSRGEEDETEGLTVEPGGAESLSDIAVKSADDDDTASASGAEAIDSADTAKAADSAGTAKAADGTDEIKAADETKTADGADAAKAAESTETAAAEEPQDASDMSEFKDIMAEIMAEKSAEKKAAAIVEDMLETAQESAPKKKTGKKAKPQSAAAESAE